MGCLRPTQNMSEFNTASSIAVECTELYCLLPEHYCSSIEDIYDITFLQVCPGGEPVRVSDTGTRFPGEHLRDPYRAGAPGCDWSLRAASPTRLPPAGGPRLCVVGGQEGALGLRLKMAYAVFAGKPYDVTVGWWDPKQRPP